jgi:large subunit ribosomal protein L18e
VAKRLEKPNTSWAEVNLRKVAENSQKGATVLICGKLLGDGEITQPVTVAAYSFSESARKKIKSSGGKSISIPELVKMNPKGTGVRIIA